MVTARPISAEALIRASGARVTQPRVRVLKVLLHSGRALSHAEVEKQVGAHAEIDRVTLYRVLEWLTGHGLAHRIAGDDRIWRYNAVSGGHDEEGEHAHFACDRCGRVVCLDDPPPAPRLRLPAGYLLQRIEMTLKGLCAACSPRSAR